jgi:aminopeptidase N
MIEPRFWPQWRAVRHAMCLIWAVIALAMPVRPLQAQHKFLPPKATIHHERDREYDLQHVLLRISLDWEKKSMAGTVKHTLHPFRKTPSIHFDAADALKIDACTVDGRPAKFEHAQSRLAVFSPAGSFVPAGKPVTVAITYSSQPLASGRTALNGVYGFHWVLPDKFEPRRKPSFWTQGETNGNHDWIPIYDYPNDKTTSEVFVTVPSDWFVVGNGQLLGNELGLGAKTRTLHWKMSQPHATYLLSLAGGEMDVVQDKWEGIELFYCVPRGEGKYIDASFGDTKRMLVFFSQRFGVKYPWPKYAQSAMFDFGGGMENVSATTLGEGSLVEARNGVWPMASLNSHEMAHQWFGDLVTCKDWGHIWLNEGFATFGEEIYLEHSRGKDAYDSARDGALSSYLAESRQHWRPIATNLYPDADSLFDSHSYSKGALVLHMLRRQLGDADFFRALGYFLRKHAYKPVDTHDLIRAIAEVTGRNTQPFFDQWVYKPGHPVIEYTWTYDEAAKKVKLDVSQLQETKDGTPVYALDAQVALITGKYATRATATVDNDKQQLIIPAAQKPDAVLLDPDRDLLMERRIKKWQPGEREAVMWVAPCWLDRRDAAASLLLDDPKDDLIKQVADAVAQDPSAEFVAAVLTRLGNLKREFLRPEFAKLLQSKDDRVRAAAVTALGKLPKDDATSRAVRLFVNEKEMFGVVTAALAALAQWDADANIDLLRYALQMGSRGEVLRQAALDAIVRSRSDVAIGDVLDSLKVEQPREVRKKAAILLRRNYLDSVRPAPVLISLLKDEDIQIVREVVSAIVDRKDKAAVPALRALAQESKDADMRQNAKTAADRLEQS